MYICGMYECRRAKGCCLSDFQIVVTSHPNTEKVTYQTHCHDCDYSCCIHFSILLKFVMFVLMMQNYICFKSHASIGYELSSILHHKKNEMLLSKISIAI